MKHQSESIFGTYMYILCRSTSNIYTTACLYTATGQPVNQVYFKYIITVVQLQYPSLTKLFLSCSQHLMAPATFFLRAYKKHVSPRSSHTFQKSEFNTVAILTHMRMLQKRIAFHFSTLTISSLLYHPTDTSARSFLLFM